MRSSFILVFSLVLSSTIPAFAGWDEGVAAFNKKNYQAAAAEFRKFVDQNPDDAQGHYMLGLSLQHLKRKEKALVQLRKAYDLNPNDLNVKVALGRAYFAAERYTETAEVLDSVDGSSLSGRERATFYRIRGRSRTETGDLSGALADLEQLARLRPDAVRAQYLYGKAAMRAGETEIGVRALAKASSLAPDNAEKKRAYGEALLQQGESTEDEAVENKSYQRALEVATELVATDPSYENQILMVSAELGAGRYKAAIETGRACVSKKIDSWQAHYHLGRALAADGQYVQAEAPLEAARNLAEDPEDLRLIWRALGFTYEKQKKYLPSIEAYQSAGDEADAARLKGIEEGGGGGR